MFLEEQPLVDAELRYRFVVVTLLDDTSSWNDKRSHRGEIVKRPEFSDGLQFAAGFES